MQDTLPKMVNYSTLPTNGMYRIVSIYNKPLSESESNGRLM